MVEFSSAGDDRVCPDCSDYEGTLLDIEEAHGIIPMHPSCRCSWIPYIPESPTENVRVRSTFCPTGQGGGVDPSCGRPTSDLVEKSTPSQQEWYDELVKVSAALKEKGEEVDPNTGGGLCYEGSKRLQDILADRGVSTKLVTGSSDMAPHTWLEAKDGTIIDSTEWQFGNPNIKPGQITAHKPGSSGAKYYKADSGKEQSIYMNQGDEHRKQFSKV